MWTTLWILWITLIQLGTPQVSDRPPRLRDRSTGAGRLRLSSGLGMVPPSRRARDE